MTKDPCGSCGSTAYYVWQKVGDVESCNECSKIQDNSPRDAWGNKVNVPSEHLGKYSYAIGEPIVSSRQYSEVLRRKNLVLARS